MICLWEIRPRQTSPDLFQYFESNSLFLWHAVRPRSKSDFTYFVVFRPDRLLRDVGKEGAMSVALLDCSQVDSTWKPLKFSPSLPTHHGNPLDKTPSASAHPSTVLTSLSMITITNQHCQCLCIAFGTEAHDRITKSQ